MAGLREIIRQFDEEESKFISKTEKPACQGLLCM